MSRVSVVNSFGCGYGAPCRKSYLHLYRHNDDTACWLVPVPNRGHRMQFVGAAPCGRPSRGRPRRGAHTDCEVSEDFHERHKESRVRMEVEGDGQDSSVDEWFLDDGVGCL